MGTEVLRPQDCLNHRFDLPVAVSRRRCSAAAGSPPRSGSRKPADPPFHQKRQQSARRGTEEAPVGKPAGKKPSAKSLTMGQVTILKRGQSLDGIKGSRACDARMDRPTNEISAGELIVSTTDRLGPDPSFIPRQIGLTAATLPRPGYAGSAFSLSPCPSSLPLPTFSVKKCFEDSATKDLRRLLRLD
ncbi:unnamed protein product [Victoria cruziana]